MSDNLENVIGEDVNLTPDQPEPQQVEPQAEQEPQEQPVEQKTVPLPALHEERARRRELQQQLQQERQAREEMERRVQARLDALAQAMQPKQDIPAFEENPAEHLKHSVEQVKQTAEMTQQQISEWRQQQAAQAQIARAAEMVRAAEAEFVRETPDYQHAVTFMLDSRTREFEAFGHDPATAKRMAAEEMAQGAISNAARGINPAEVAYKLARARGYNPQSSAADKMQMQQRGAMAAKSLGTGGAAVGKLSAKALAEMSDDEFAEATKGNNWKKLMGG